jgi:mRNA interferase MazF
MGGEIQKVRPAVIVSNDAANEMMNRVQVIPLTSNVGKLYPCEACVEIEGRRSKAVADQIATVSKLRFKTKLGKVSQQHLCDIEQAIKIQLAL